MDIIDELSDKTECCADRLCGVNYEPIVVKVIEIIDISNGTPSIKYVVAIKISNGVMLEEKEVDSLKNISYFILWGCPDALLTGNQKKILEDKLQREAVEAQREKVYLCPQGVHEVESNLFMVFGNMVLGKPPSDGIIRIKEPKKLINKDMHLVLLGEITKKFIMLLPGVTEMLFYGAMFAVLRPILCHMGYKPDFMLALIGPSGHLKTTLAESYAMWLEDSSEQKVSFRDYGRFDDVLKRADNLIGQNFLADDLHMAGSRSGHERQNERLDILCRHVSGAKQCAQIVLTGESLDNMGIFSSRDRILQIKVPKMKSDELADVKRKLSGIQFEFIPGLAVEFAKELLNHQEELKNDIEGYWTENILYDTERDYSLRISQHAEYLKLTELLYRKYLLHSSEEDSCKKQLYEAIDNNYIIQSRELQDLRKEGERDMVVDLYNMLNGNYLSRVTNIYAYRPNDTCELCYYLTNGKIYVTRNILQTGMNRYLGRTCSAKKLSDAMHDAGVLEEDTDARTKKFSACRHYVINYELLRQYCKMKSEI